jgi:hypothetical protein
VNANKNPTKTKLPIVAIGDLYNTTPTPKYNAQQTLEVQESIQKSNHFIFSIIPYTN